MRIEPWCGVSSPAIARSKVVLPLPDGPSSATTSPRETVIDAPLRISLSPSRTARSRTSNSAMEAYSQSNGDGQSEADHDDVDDGQGGHEVDRAGTPKRNKQGADHLGPGPQQIDAGRIFAHENQKDQQPACHHAGTRERQRHVALD